MYQIELLKEEGRGLGSFYDEREKGKLGLVIKA